MNASVNRPFIIIEWADLQLESGEILVAHKEIIIFIISKGLGCKDYFYYLEVIKSNLH